MDNINELRNHVKQFAECLFANNGNYHNHKETMAHACVVLEIVIFGWIISKDGWAIATSVGWIEFIFVSIGIWLPLHLYMRWELRNRRFSAIQDTAIRQIIAKWTTTKPAIEQIQPYKNKPHYPCWFYRLLDYVIPCFRGGLPVEHSVPNYPTEFVDALKKSAKENNWNLYLGEWLPSFISLLLICIVLIRKFTDC